MKQRDLTERELNAWRTSIQMMEQLRTRIEQQLQTTSGLSNADYTVLSVLSETSDGRLRPYELGRQLGWEKSRVHHQMTRMCKRGLISRERCGSRGMYAALTADGLAAITEAAPCHAQQVRNLFIDQFTADELDQFAELAGKVLDNLQAEQPIGS